MRKIFTHLLCLLGFFIIGFYPVDSYTQPTDEEIQASINAGIDYLIYGTIYNDHGQNDDGSWDYEPGLNQVAHTGIVLVKLCEYAYELGFDSPFDEDYEWSQNVADGFEYLYTKIRHTSYTYTYCDGGSVPMVGMYIGNEPVGAQPEMYNAAMATMAFGACNTPSREIVSSDPDVNGMTHFELMQEMVDFYRWAQNQEAPPSTNFGGWGNRPWLAPFCDHFWGNAYSDNSSSGYVVFALMAAEEMGCAIPTGLKEDLSLWIDYIQIEEPYVGAGGSGYALDETDPNGNPPRHNSLRTGNLLAEMAFAGYPLSHVRVQNALDYISTYWDTPRAVDFYSDQTTEGWDFWPMAMYSLMKGFKSYGLKTITVEGVERNWYNEFSTQLLGSVIDPGGNEVDWQFWSGNWALGWWGNDITNTCWALLILEGALPDFIPVDLDVHPTSWPNPLNVNSNGNYPAAILGTEDFDVTTIDPATLLLEGVAPIQWNFEDVTTPFPVEQCNATELGPDGYLDLTIHFNKQELVAALGQVYNGDEIVITLTGLDYNGQSIQGDDCIRIIGNSNIISGIDPKTDSPTFSLYQNVPNPFNDKTTIEFYLPEKTQVGLDIFNLYGQKVMTITNKIYLAGKHNVQIMPTDLEAGTYFYTLSSSSNTATRKLIIN